MFHDDFYRQFVRQFVRRVLRHNPHLLARKDALTCLARPDRAGGEAPTLRPVYGKAERQRPKPQP